MTRALRTSTFGVGLVAAVLLLSACSTPSPGGETAQQPTTTAEAPPAATPEAPDDGSTPEPTDSAPAEPTCEGILSSSLVESFTEQGWTARPGPFYIGSMELKQGLSCTWGDFEGPSNDSGQIYGWAEITDAQQVDAEKDLLAQGWKREKADGAVYITEDPKNAPIKDDEGYGMTYLFRDGWVSVADTKQALLLISPPK